MSVFYDTKQSIIRIIIHILGFFRGSDKKVLFESFGARQYSDSPRAISEMLHEIFPDYKIVWAFNAPEEYEEIVPQYVKRIKKKSLSFINEFITASAYVSNCTIPYSLYKKKGQFFVQTWHGDRGFKKILYDVVPKENRSPIETDTDLMISGSSFALGVIKSAFGYNGEILNKGLPRNDRLVLNKCEEVKKIREKIGIRNDQKLLLYAPTYRDSRQGAEDLHINMEQTLEHLEQRGDNWICAVRAHAASHGLKTEGHKMIDLSDYPDMAELLLAADMLITDYSSCAGDFILMDKPLILAHFDRNEYKKNCRDFYFDPDRSGYIISKNQDELNSIIDTYSAEDYISSNRRVREFYGVTETGKASEAVCKRIDEFYRNNCGKG